MKKVTYKLWEAKLITVTNNTFLKAFLSGSISCENLKTKAKGVLIEGTETYNKIMDKIHVDYRAQTSTEKIRVSNFLSKNQLHRGKLSDVSTKWKGSLTTYPLVHGHTKLPHNIDNLLPNAYYQHFKGWYEASRVPEMERSEEQKKFLSSFKWQHNVDPKNKLPWTAPSQPREDQHRNYDDHCSGRVTGRDKWSRSPSSELCSDDSGTATATAHAVDVNKGTDPGPRTFPNPAPLWRVVVRTVTVLGMAHLAPAVPVS